MSNSLISLLILALGATILGLGVVQFFRQRARINRFLQAEGTVTEILQQRAEGEHIRRKTKSGRRIETKYLYRPVIEFVSQHGRTIRFQPSIAQRPSPFQVGDKVNVLYDPENPKSAVVNNFMHRWFAVLILFLFGLFFIGMGILGRVLS